MAKYNNMVITNDGKDIYVKAIAGKTIEFTKVVVGSGKPESQEIAETLSNLIDPKLAGSITINTTAQDNKAVITVSLSNETLLQPLSIQELGLFCKDPDTNEEVMYAYCFSEDDTDVIPAIISGDMVWKMQLVVYISNATGSNTLQEESSISVIATATDGATEFLSNVAAKVDFAINGNLMTAFYKITGTLANMIKAENGLSSLTIALPRKSKVNCGVSGRMVVTDTDNNKTLVLVSGEIAKDGEVINMDYFGAQDGNFNLLMTVHYAI